MFCQVDPSEVYISTHMHVIVVVYSVIASKQSTIPTVQYIWYVFLKGFFLVHCWRGRRMNWLLLYDGS